jgi:DnaJ-class molecular chaperone
MTHKSFAMLLSARAKAQVLFPAAATRNHFSTSGHNRNSGNSKCLYDSLGLAQCATKDDIKSAYYTLSKSFHPDRNKTEEGAQRFREVADAYAVLGNADRKVTYDATVDGGGKINGYANRVSN